MTLEIGSALTAAMLDCKPDVVATGEYTVGREYIEMVNALYRHK